MTGTKYGDLVKPLSFKKGRGGANARELVFMSGDELAGFEFNFIVGVYDQTGDWAPGRGAHVHPFDECLLFFGYDTGDMGFLGSDMEISLGKEQEKHKFSVPTTVIAPRGVPHCPLITEKVDKPFGHFHLALNTKYSAEAVKQEGKTDGKKYAHLVKKMQINEGPGGANAKQTVFMSGRELENLNLNFTMGLYEKTGKWYPDQGAHLHPYNECLIFFGNNADNLSYLGAELTIEIGQEHEKHTFGVPTVVSIPKGLQHLPVICSKVDKPYRVMRVGLGPNHEVSWVA